MNAKESREKWNTIERNLSKQRRKFLVSMLIGYMIEVENIEHLVRFNKRTIEIFQTR